MDLGSEFEVNSDELFQTRMKTREHGPTLSSSLQLLLFLHVHVDTAPGSVPVSHIQEFLSLLKKEVMGFNESIHQERSTILR